MSAISSPMDISPVPNAVSAETVTAAIVQHSYGLPFTVLGSDRGKQDEYVEVWLELKHDPTGSF